MCCEIRHVQLAVDLASLWFAAKKPTNLGTQAANSQAVTSIVSATFLCCSSSPRKLMWIRVQAVCLQGTGISDTLSLDHSGTASDTCKARF